MTYKPIRSWPKSERPVERLIKLGPAALTSAELIAVLINNGMRGRSAIDIGRDLLEKAGDDLEKLASMTPVQLTAVRGIGIHKAARLIAALSLSRRLDTGKAPSRIFLKKPEDVPHFLKYLLKNERQEVFVVFFLTQNLHIRHWEMVSKGGITGTTVDPRLIFRRALEYGATRLILCHNHPSGSLQPSPADIEATEKIRLGAATVDILLLDHIIVSDQGWYSFANEKLLEQSWKRRR
ncbi:MAG TPA: DNA repair protein RadC [Dinghuibacter sp.]|jgi:DNA repair protein RadC|uniref:RadC family protein n=1 Tax=Dinghuibacter sp. TaxID=2024697 RepID=UPI002CA02BCE|nr:DNA repair protein RadC [Dinghuibacter sp.]HTJ12860.1 DNA repair protein RadC [Dinghuibacter sp.]